MGDMSPPMPISIRKTLSDCAIEGQKATEMRAWYKSSYFSDMRQRSIARHGKKFCEAKLIATHLRKTRRI